MSVHYKFKSNLDHDTVTFDGLSISVADLKKAIMHQKKIGKSSDFDLQITNAQTKEVYDSEETLVPKNTSVIVARVPVSSGSKKNWDRPDLPLPIGLDDDDFGQIRYDRIAKSADLVNANATEEDKVKAMITQSSQEYDPSKYVKSRSMTGPLPPTYTCYRCGKHGHWIKDCPTNNPDVKRSTGIPRSFMVPVDGPEHKGALLTSSGEYAVPLIDHHAYKEVKKEKPPFVPQEEPEVEPEAQIPEELLCMLCRDLLQDAVLIPCCGNSFCDECVRQVLLESDNHECPLCHETEISPDTVIPNRFLRTAVLNYKNETGYTRIKRPSIDNNSQSMQHVDSPQPSPDSTVETHPANSSITDVCEEVEKTKESTETSTPVIDERKRSKDDKKQSSNDKSPERTDVLKDCLGEEIEDIQPGTPLADEPAEMSQSLPIQAIGQEQFDNDKREERSGSRYSRHRRGEYGHYYSDRRSHSPEKHAISTISTISNVWSQNRKSKYNVMPRVPTRPPYQSQRHNDDRSENYGSDRDDYSSRYSRRYNDRSSHRPPQHYRDYRSRDSRYHSEYDTEPEYPPVESAHHEPQYDSRGHIDERRHPERFNSPPVPPIHVEAALPPPMYPIASIPHHLPCIPAPIMQAPPLYAMQPPPPGSSPIDTSQTAAQPPPPGVGPLIPPLAEPPMSYVPFDSEDPLKEPKKIDDRSIDDKMEAFQRELEQRDRKERDRISRSPGRVRSRSTSRTFSSKSWTRSPSRSSTRTPRSHSRTPFSSRSRSRSYTRSRSRSWSKPRSYTRSRSRTRTDSRSRSRSRNESRIRRKNSRDRDRIRSPLIRSRSHSYSPRDYRAARSSYHGKRIFSPPRYGSSYQPQYGAPPTPLSLPLMRPPSYPPHHVHPIHPITHPIHPHPTGHYPIERPRYETYSEEYHSYEAYPQNAQKPYQHQKYEREQKAVRYDKRQEYQRQEEVAHRIPGWVGDRSRDNKTRYRPREQRKEIIKELPKVSDYELKAMHAKEVSEEPVKKKEEKTVSKHKKHHHHHKTKDSKKQEKQENKIPVIVGVDKHSEVSQNLIKVETSEKVVALREANSVSVKTSKTEDKVKERKHKHKKHKASEQAKKKKASKKEKTDESTSDAPSLKTKTKRKKAKVKSIEELKPQNDPPKEEISIAIDIPVVDSKLYLTPVPEQKTVTVPEVEAIPDEVPTSKPVSKDKITSHLEDSHAADTLDIFADDTDCDAGLVTETVEEPVVEAVAVDIVGGLFDDSVDEGDTAENPDIEEEQAEESEGGEDKEKEDILHVDVPALSKWETEEFEEVFTSKPQRKSAVIIPKEGKGALSSEIIQRAEKAILSKPLKTAILNPNKDIKIVPKSSNKEESVTLHSNDVAVKIKDSSDVKSAAVPERLPSPILQVTITTVKDKRSIRPKKESSSRSIKEDLLQSKRVKLDRSGFKSSTESSSKSHRTVTVADNSHSSTRSDEKHRIGEHRQQSSTSRRDGRRYSPEKESSSSAYRDRKESSRTVDKSRDSHRQNDHRHDRKRYGDHEKVSRDDSRDKKKTPHEPTSRDTSRKSHVNIEPSKPHSSSNRKESIAKQLRSESNESSDSYSGSKKTKHSKVPIATLQKTKSRDSDSKERLKKVSSEMPAPGRKHSPIKAPETSGDHSKHKQSSSKNFPQDVLKFEPDYDEFSDEENKRREEKKLKRTHETSESSSRKRPKQEDTSSDSKVVKKKRKAATSSSTSSPSSSVASDSDSSDTEDNKGSKSRSSDTDAKQRHKRSRHKKHKKHKHKHKKKKSHKSSR